MFFADHVQRSLASLFYSFTVLVFSHVALGIEGGTCHHLWIYLGKGGGWTSVAGQDDGHVERD